MKSIIRDYIKKKFNLTEFPISPKVLTGFYNVGKYDVYVWDLFKDGGYHVAQISIIGHKKCDALLFKVTNFNSERVIVEGRLFKKGTENKPENILLLQNMMNLAYYLLKKKFR